MQATTIAPPAGSSSGAPHRSDPRYSPAANTTTTHILQPRRKSRSPLKPTAALPSATSRAAGSAMASSNGSHAHVGGEAGPSNPAARMPIGIRTLLSDAPAPGEDVSMPSSPGRTDYEDATEGEGNETVAEEDIDGDDDGEEGDEEDDDDEEDDEESGSDSEDDDDDNDGPELLTHGPMNSAFPTDGKVKTEPLDPSAPTDPSAAGAPTDGGEPADPTASGETVNTLKPKKKRKLAAVESDEEPYIPPPVPTIRLSKTLIKGESVIWNVLDTAKEEKLISSWGAGYDPANPDAAEGLDGEGDIGMATEGAGAEATGVEAEVGGLGLGIGDGGPPPGSHGGPSGIGGLMGMGGEGEWTAEEIARRLEEKYADKPKRKVKIKRKKVDYDLEDPFIDDSELQIDAPTHYARPKKEGFFVHMGKVELAEEEPTRARARTANKAKAPKQTPSAIVLPSLSEATRERIGVDQRGDGSRNSPIMIDEEFEDGRAKPAPRASRSPSPPYTPRPVDRSLYKNASNDINLLPPFPHFPRPLRRALLALLESSHKHSWDLNNKNKFPENLKPPLRNAAKAAFWYDYFSAHDERTMPKEFFSSLPSCLPYNQFTLMKLSIKLVYDDFRRWLEEREKTGLLQFQHLVDATKESWIQKYEAAQEAYKADKAAWDQANPSQNGATGNSSTLPAEDQPMDLTGDDDEPKETPNGMAGAAPGPPKEPRKMFTWTPEMRTLLADLVDNMSELVGLSARAVEWRLGPSSAEKEATLKSALYRKVVDCFPDGYSHPNIVSNQMSKAKKQGQAATES